ncbi:protein translocase subunit SecD [Patulibacter defluvii]|uniref:protein translocase subunit SecD n=1 Tax=Patulibacter defluvii TaxID=3095358 RepID=UPI002A759AB9|nr:protein translocase subunit SecD [Patulibacter sp. DM4]
MTDRRRNLLILLAVGILLAASAVALATKPTKLGLDLKGGVQLIYEVSPTKGETLDEATLQRTIDVMQERVNSLGVAEAELQRSGDRQIDVALPDVSNPQEAADTVGSTAKMAFYDWEANVVGPDGQINAADPQISQIGGSRQSPAATTAYGAVMRAKNLKSTNTGKEVSADQWYLVNDRTKAVLAGPERSTQELDKSSNVQRALRGLRTQIPDAAKRLAADGNAKPLRYVKVPQGYRVVEAEDDPENKDFKGDPIALPNSRWFVLRDQAALEGEDVRNPAQTFDTSPGAANRPVVSFEFSDRGQKIWKDTTKAIVDRGRDNCVPQAGETRQQQAQRCSNHFAIVLDQKLVTTPYIDFNENPNGISGAGGSQISGQFTVKSAQTLANQLKSGSLPLELNLISQQQVSATLGQEALDQGLIAGIVGFIGVALFLLAFYRALGLIAIVGLAAYTLFFLALVKLIPIVLTLPGIAGLILTIAVAADANVVIFERVKDELQAGRSVPRAIKDGYRKGLSAIIDGNVITFLVAFILFMVATAGVKGFALNLGIGVLISMLTAIALTRAILGLVGRSRLITHPTMLGARKRNPIWHRYDFVKASKWFFAMSGVILAIGAIAIGAKGLNFGIDFESGTQIKATARAGTSVDQVRDALRPVGLADAKIQTVQLTGEAARQRAGGTTFQIATEALDRQRLGRVTNELQKLGVNPAQLDTNTVGPTFGKTVARSAIVAILASFAVIAFVIWFRFGLRYTMPILIAVVHDLLITAGIYALTGAEVTASTVAALLTIIGYSLYDTIIVFDRVRENLKRLPSAAFSQIINRSMSEVLGRSLVTSFSAGLPTLALLLFGGDTLKDFALAMLIGTLSGAYSSVFIASPVLTEWVERLPAFKARRKRLIAANGGVLPAYPEGNKTGEVDPFAQREKRARLTAPEPEGNEVSSDEFRQMVADLGIDEAPAQTPKKRQRRAAAAAPEPEAPAKEDAAGAPPERAADLSPEEVVMKDEKPRGARKSKSNKRHGRPR